MEGTQFWVSKEFIIIMLKLPTKAVIASLAETPASQIYTRTPDNIDLFTLCEKYSPLQCIVVVGSGPPG